ncbi:MAG: GAF and HD-GYP domain-containing protein [Planctomycetota bacterium]
MQSLREAGVSLSGVEDRQAILEMVLTEARKLTRAEAGSFYIFQGGALRFVAAQNDRLPRRKIDSLLLGKELRAEKDSLAGFAASTGQIVNIRDSYKLPAGAPFRVHRKFDSATGYRVRSVLAIPLKCPDGTCVGVLQLINRVTSDGQIIAFADEQCESIRPLTTMAAVTIHNVLLQEQLKQAQLDCIIRLSVAAEFRDDDTAEHIRRISRSSALIAAALGLEKHRVELIQHASPMHDVGKIGIPDSILRKPGPLTPAEWQIVQTHPLIGGEILIDPSNELIKTAREVALTHHEKFDGTGYPKGLTGEKIPLSGRIVSLADVFDALVSKRCYKEPLNVNEALDIIHREKSKHFDPDVTAAFLDRTDVIMASYGNLHQD